MNKITLYYILVICLFIDIITTLIAVLYLDGTEINPLCNNFMYFFKYKMLVSCTGLIGIWFLKDTSLWKLYVTFLIILYGDVVIINFLGAFSYYYL